MTQARGPLHPHSRMKAPLLPAILIAAAGVALLLAAGRPAAPEGAGADGEGTAARLAARMLASGSLEGDLQMLCDRIGGRPTGSPACERAIDWAVDRFRTAGVDRAWTEPFTLPLRWDEERSRAEIVAPDRLPLRVIAMPYSPGTPKGGLTARLVLLGAGGADDFRRAGDRLKGAIGLVSSKVIVTWEDLFEDYIRLPAILERAREAGAAALLVTGGREDGMLYRHVATFGDPAPLPVGILAREDGLRCERLAADGDVRLTLDLGGRIGKAFESRNVLAEIKGRDLPDEVVLVGAHLDSWETGTGALDNAANCAMVLDLARQMSSLGERPRRTVRFALFTGEEQGMFGSLGYARTHRADLDRHVAVAIYDAGTGRITGFSLGGREDLREAVVAALAPLRGYDANTHTVDAFVGTDNFDFLLEGVPNLVANQEPSNYMANYHASSDTYDKIDRRELRLNGAVAASLAWGLSQSGARAPRQDRAAITALLRSTGLEDQMKTFGMWKSWETGRRGRPH